MKPTRASAILAAFAATLALFPCLHAQTEEEQLPVLETFSVIGSDERLDTLPGSGYLIDIKTIDTFNYSNINRFLNQVPGVYFRQEDGYGNFPNISLRGVDTTRSAKVTIMEDGVISAPAPYSAPSAYYSPNTGRMAGFEILKGSSQIKYGPHTTGGVINYLSTPLPTTEGISGQAEFAIGADNAFLTHDYIGQLIETNMGSFSYLLEYFHEETDGFREIDDVGNMTDSDETGFERSEYMVKLGFEPNWQRRNFFEFKIGYTDFDADETYLGLNDADFERDPYRRYAASRLDVINTYQTRTYLRHLIELSPDTTITSTGYYNKFHRNWYKLHDIRDIDTDGNGIPQSLEGNPREGESLPTAVGGARNGQALEVLKGQRAGILRVRANNRDYELKGFQTKVNHTITGERMTHEIEAGIRFHEDMIRRKQLNDLFEQDANGDFVTTTRGTPGDAGNRRQTTEAFAIYAEDTISFGDWTVSPGVRYETLDYIFKQFAEPGGNPEGPEQTGDLAVFAPGVGFTYTQSEQVRFFGGLYRGFSVPGPRAVINGGVTEETSTALELGVRYRAEPWFGELVVYYSAFEDLIVPENIAAGTTATENVGEARVYGIEAIIGTDLGELNDWAFSSPWQMSFTYTSAELTSDSTSIDTESLFAGGEDGNRIPYTPEFQFNLTGGIEFEKVSANVSASYIGDSFGTATESDDPFDPIANEPNARFGKIDSSFVVDLAVDYEVLDGLVLYANITNLLDEEYIGARHPHGPRAGAPRLWWLGARYTF